MNTQIMSHNVKRMQNDENFRFLSDMEFYLYYLLLYWDIELEDRETLRRILMNNSQQTVITAVRRVEKRAQYEKVQQNLISLF